MYQRGGVLVGPRPPPLDDVSDALVPHSLPAPPSRSARLLIRYQARRVRTIATSITLARSVPDIPKRQTSRPQQAAG